MRSDKIEERSKALRALTNTIQSNTRLKEKFIPYGSDQVFKIVIPDPLNTDIALHIYDLFTDFQKVTRD